MALKLGKGSAFVKSRLRRLPQESEVWEADFLPKANYWMGLVIEQEHGAVFAMKMLETTPTVNDLAHLWISGNEFDGRKPLLLNSQ